MKAWILSDLHGETVPIPPDADIALIAGDVCNESWLIEVAQRIPVVFVAGNHEFYGSSVAKRDEEMFDLCVQNSRLHYLENDTLHLWWCNSRLNIAGATLWTDYNDGDPVAMGHARRGMNDHRCIWNFMPLHALKMHRESLDYLRNSGADVIMTHHAPHRNSVHPRYAGQLLNYAFFSDVLETFDNPPKLWIHGHMHDNFDYVVGKTRVICNPLGYPGENAAFDPAMILEI